MTKIRKFMLGENEYRDWGLLLLRVGVGFLMFYNHGFGKLMGGPEKWNAIGLSGMTALGIDLGHTFFGFAAALSESVGALLIAVGLFLRPSSIMLFLTMFVAVMYHFSVGRGNPEKAVLYGLVFLALVWFGPGKFSLDHKIFQKG